MTDLSFVVPAYNEAQHLPATLAALRKAGEASGRSWEIVVTDNASTDATAELARAHGARVVAEPFRQIARARNRGAAEASGRYLLFVDADTLISTTLAHAALEALDSGKVVGGGSVLQFDGKGLLPRLLIAPWNLASRHLRLAAGSFVFCLKEAWVESGGFDERLYASEEIWFSLALKRWGKPRALSFEVLEGNPPQTSARKVKGWGTAGFLLQFLLLNLRPWLLRSRRACFLWYRR